MTAKTEIFKLIETLPKELQEDALRYIKDLASKQEKDSRIKDKRKFEIPTKIAFFNTLKKHVVKLLIFSDSEQFFIN